MSDKVKLISVSSPTVEGLETAEDLIVYCARVSNPSNQLNTETGNKLLKYCAKHGHWSVFEMANMTLEINTTRAIAAQILRHKSFSFQEFSQRYSDVSEVGLDIVHPRRQDTKNRQNSFDDLSGEDQDWFLNTMLGLNEVCKLAYKEAIDRGIAKESARFLLPMTTKTRMYMSGSVRNWIHYLQSRLDESTQKEHRDIAYGVLRVFKEKFPIVAEACLGD